MIKLDVKEYCQNCPGFVPETDSERIASVDGRQLVHVTTVYCKYQARCANIARYLEKEIERQHEQREELAD